MAEEKTSGQMLITSRRRRKNSQGLRIARLQYSSR
jgi:hypothetical protein